ncbi:hypothetical protein REIS_0255 [Rickettsia endosymbiont of Ixodes scapularis]|nr:hypothetical protein REIS_0255 [Rickettsia endosymbiont of Ixodes scapularis]
MFGKVFSVIPWLDRGIQKKIKKGLDPAIKSRDDGGGIDPRNNASRE